MKATVQKCCASCVFCATSHEYGHIEIRCEHGRRNGLSFDDLPRTHYYLACVNHKAMDGLSDEEVAMEKSTQEYEDSLVQHLMDKL